MAGLLAGIHRLEPGESDQGWSEAQLLDADVASRLLLAGEGGLFLNSFFPYVRPGAQHSTTVTALPSQPTGAVVEDGSGRDRRRFTWDRFGEAYLDAHCIEQPQGAQDHWTVESLLVSALERPLQARRLIAMSPEEPRKPTFSERSMALRGQTVVVRGSCQTLERMEDESLWLGVGIQRPWRPRAAPIRSSNP